jgi:GTPase SAR1 family protein
VFDLTDPPSFGEVQNYWLQEARNNCEEENELICLVGNKKDGGVKVDKNGVEQFCAAEKLPFYYISAKTGEGVHDMFLAIT